MKKKSFGKMKNFCYKLFKKKIVYAEHLRRSFFVVNKMKEKVFYQVEAKVSYLFFPRKVIVRIKISKK